MEKFQNLGRSLTKDEQKRIAGAVGDEGQTCTTTCSNGKKWSLDCSGSCYAAGEDAPGYIVCNNEYYNYGC